MLNGGQPADMPLPQEVRWIEVDLSEARLPADLQSLDNLATAAAHVYERFVRHADEGWEWVVHPGSREFDGWVVDERQGRRVIKAARLLCRRTPLDESAAPAAHGVSAYRTRQLTGRPWTAEPGSKLWKPLSR